MRAHSSVGSAVCPGCLTRIRRLDLGGNAIFRTRLVKRNFFPATGSVKGKRNLKGWCVLVFVTEGKGAGDD